MEHPLPVTPREAPTSRKVPAPPRIAPAAVTKIEETILPGVLDLRFVGKQLEKLVVVVRTTWAGEARQIDRVQEWRQVETVKPGA